MATNFLPGKFHGQKSQAGYRPWEERKKLVISTASTPVFCLPQPRGTNPARKFKNKIKLKKNNKAAISIHIQKKEIVPLTGTGKAGYMISYLSLLGLCVRNPLCLCPTQTPAELRQATEMAGARKKSKNSPTSQVPGDNPSSHWPALRRTQRFLSLRKSTSLEQPL